MAKPKEAPNSADAAMSAIAEVLNSTKNLTQADIEEILKKLAKVSEQGARNKLPGVTSDHSFLYRDGAPA